MSTPVTKERQGSIFGHVLTASLIGMSACLLSTVAPYFIDADCSKSGYAPVSATSCLSEAEIAKTDWEVGVPIGGVTYYITDDQPLIQVVPPMIFNLTVYVSGVMLCLFVVVALIRLLIAPLLRPVAVEELERGDGEVHRSLSRHLD